MKTSTKERWLAIAVGICASTAALAILWQDVLIAGAHPTLDHFLMIAIVGITIAAGHLAVKGRTVGAFIGFGFVFALGLALTVYTSVGRQAEVADTASKRAEVVAAERSRVMSLRSRAEAMQQEATAKLAVECRTGKGPKCDGIRATVDVYTAAVKGHDADLAKLPVIVNAARSSRFADVMELGGLSREKTQHVAYLLEPFAYSLFFELCAIVAFGYGFGGRRPVKVANDNPKEPDVIPVPDIPDIEPSNDSKVVAWAEAWKKKHGRYPELAEAIEHSGLDIAKTTLWRIMHRNGVIAQKAA